jgi:hypothetical protein
MNRKQAVPNAKFLITWSAGGKTMAVQPLAAIASLITAYPGNRVALEALEMPKLKIPTILIIIEPVLDRIIKLINLILQAETKITKLTLQNNQGLAARAVLARKLVIKLKTSVMKRPVTMLTGRSPVVF